MPKGKVVYGVTAMYDDVYLVRDGVPEVEVYDSNTLGLQRRLAVKGLRRPWDMTSSTRYSCLYIADTSQTTFGRGHSDIYRIEIKGKTTKWSAKDKVASLSLGTGGWNLITTCNSANKLKEYTTHGQLIRQIRLQTGIRHPWYAVQLADDQFLVSYGRSSDTASCIVLIDADGLPITNRTSGIEVAARSAMENAPRHLAVTGSGLVIVPDATRLLLMNSPLTKICNLASVNGKTTTFKYIIRLCLDETRRRLYVATCERIQRSNTSLAGSVSVFRLGNMSTETK